LTAGSDYTVSGDQITLTSPPATGTDVVIAIFAGGASTATQISVQTLAFNLGQSWTLVPNDTQTNPEISGTIVEVDGLRLTPDADYTVTDGVLTITAALDSSDVIIATLFTNAVSMTMETEAFSVSGHFYDIPIPWDKSYAMVWLNGLLLVPDIDYAIEPETALPYGFGPYGIGSYNAIGNSSRLNVFASTLGHLVVTVFTAPAATGTTQWMINSRRTAMARMLPAYDTSGEPIIGTPTHGSAFLQPLYTIDDEYLLLSPLTAGTLLADLNPGDVTISVELFLETVSAKLLPDQPLTIPRGSIWIGPERIEYLGYSRSGNVVTLSQLRRATRGTAIEEQRTVAILTGTGVTQTHTFTGTGKVDASADGLGIAFSAAIVSGNTVVTFVAPHNSYVAIGFTTGYVYPSGTIIYNGDTQFTPPIPLTPEVGENEGDDIAALHEFIVRWTEP
jgi:hypothetical protein